MHLLRGSIRNEVWPVYRNLLLLPIVSMWPCKSVGKFSIDGKLVELGLGIPSMETFPRLNKNSPGDSFPRWKICWVRLDIPLMETFLNRRSFHRWKCVYIYPYQILIHRLNILERNFALSIDGILNIYIYIYEIKNV